MRTIAISNQKGGAGKTTTAVNLSAAFAALGKSVLLTDLDPQGHSTLGVGVDADELDNTLYEVMTDEHCSMSEIIVDSNVDNLSVAPGNILLSGIDVDLDKIAKREFI